MDSFLKYIKPPISPHARSTLKVFSVFFFLFLFITVLQASPVQSKKHNETSKSYETILKNGYKAFKAKEYKKAAELLNTIPYDYILKDYALYFTFISYLETGKQKKADAILKELTARYPKNIVSEDALLKRAEKYLLKDNLKEAEKGFKDIIKKRENSEVLFMLAKTYNAAHNPKKAFKYLLAVWRDYPASPFASKSDDLIKEMIKQNPSAIHITPLDRYKRAKNLYRHSLYDEALIELKKLDTKDHIGLPKLIDAGIMRFRLRDFKETKIWFGKLLKKQDKRFQEKILFYHAMSSLRTGDKTLAEKEFKDISARFPKGSFAVKALFQRAQLIKNNGERKDINAYMDILKSAYRAYPKNPMRWTIIRELAWSAYRIGKLDESEKYLKKLSLGPFPLNKEAQYWLANVAGLKGNNKEKTSLLKRLASSTHPTYYTLLALKSLGDSNTGHQPALTKKSLYNDTADNYKSLEFKRAKSLIDIGLFKMARKELISYAKKIKKGNEKEILGLSNLLFKANDFHRSLNYAVNYLYSASIGTDSVIWKLSYPMGFKTVVERESKKYNISPALLYAVIREESSFDPGGVSLSDARGLMQIIPSTGSFIAKNLKDKNFNKESLFDPESNIRFGAWYIKKMLNRFNGNAPLAIAAYNAGPGKVSRWFKKKKNISIEEFVEDIPFSETRRYVKKVLTSYYRYRMLYFNNTPASFDEMARKEGSFVKKSTEVMGLKDSRGQGFE